MTEGGKQRMGADHAPERRDILDAVEALFPHGEREAAMSLLDQYQTGIWKERKERIQMAALVLCEGSIDKLREFMQEASEDYRNLLCWCDSTQHGVELRSALERRICEIRRNKIGSDAGRNAL